jgi:hypothetical protein
MERKHASTIAELLDLFHEYQHGEISGTSSAGTRFAVGGLTVAAIFETATATRGRNGAQGRCAASRLGRDGAVA